MGEVKAMNLAQKFVELRKACPEVTKKKHSDGVKYKFAKINDIYVLLSPAMNACGVDWDIIREAPTMRDENGAPKFFDSYVQNTKSGPRTIWVYEADIVLLWVNVDDPAETREVVLHALGTNDASPDKAKGAAWTYCIKYYLFTKFGIDQGEDDPDNNDWTQSDVKPAQKPAGRPQTSAAPQGAQRPAPAPVKAAPAAQAAAVPEKAPAAQPASAAPYRFKNGPHAGQTPAEVWAADPDYIRYVSALPKCPAEVLAVMK